MLRSPSDIRRDLHLGVLDNSSKSRSLVRLDRRDNDSISLCSAYSSVFPSLAIVVTIEISCNDNLMMICEFRMTEIGRVDRQNDRVINERE